MSLSLHRRRHGFTLVELLVVIVIIGILAGLLIPVIGSTIRQANTAACAHNLSQLFKMTQVYASRYRGRYPSAKGKDFWLALQKTTPPLINEDLSEVFACAFNEQFGGAGCCDYRGPSKSVGTMDPSDLVGADVAGNHGEGYGGNVLRWAGDVTTVDLNEELWTRADSTLKE